MSDFYSGTPVYCSRCGSKLKAVNANLYNVYTGEAEDSREIYCPTMDLDHDKWLKDDTNTFWYKRTFRKKQSWI